MLPSFRARPVRAPLVAVAVVLALAVGAAGCGGDSTKETYKKDFKTAGESFQRDAQQASTQVTGSPGAAGKVAGLESLKTAVSKAASSFSTLKPPDNAKTENGDLVNELRALGTDIDKIEVAVKAKDQTAAQQLVPELQTQQTKIQSTLQALKAKVDK